MIRRYKAILALCALPVFYTACEDDYNFTEPVRSFDISPVFTGIDDGTSVQLTATSGGAPVPVTWSSDNTAVITVSATGLATARGPGVTSVIASLASNPSEKATASITVNALVGIALSKGVAVTGLSGPTGNQKLYRIFSPAGTTNLTVTLRGGTGDADIYMQRGSPPTTSVASHWSFNGGNDEDISINNPQSGTWYILVDAWIAYTGATLTATYTP